MSLDSFAPLADLRVLDASRVLAGPFCGQLLGDLGAEVVKVERPGTGDETRGWGPPFAGALSAYFLSCNRNKKAITLDLGKPEGLELFYQLVRRADVLIENFRCASVDKLGISPEQLLRINPRLVVCSITGYGRTGPMSDVPGYDFAVQGLSGLMSITGPAEGPPSKVGVAVTDILTGLYAASAILACLRARERSGHGYAIDLALLDCAVAAQVNVVQAYLTSGIVPPRQGNAHLQIVPYQAFAAADGWLILAVGNDGQWQRFCTVVLRADWAGDPRFATNRLRVENRLALVPMVEAEMLKRTRKEWLQSLEQAEVPCAPVLDYEQTFALEQAVARGLKVSVRDVDGRPVDLVGSPLHVSGTTLPEPSMPPRLGEHTDEVLMQWLGTERAALDEFRNNGVI